MSQPTTIEKTELLAHIQQAYAQLEALLASLSVEQMTTPGVNGAWSVKDNIAHLTAWQDYALTRFQNISTGQKPPLPWSGIEDDEVNEQIYQQNKDRPLPEVLADFRASYQRALEAVQAISQDSLNAPFPWNKDGQPVWAYVQADTYEHYDEHSALIRRGLNASNKA